MIKIKFGDGTIRYLGSSPSPRNIVASVPRWAEHVLPESDWTAFEEPPPEVAIEDQDGKGACNGHAAATAVMLARHVAGYGHVRLSPWFVYSILCNGVDRGSNIMDALKLTSDTGVAPWDAVPYGTINPRSLSSAAKAEAGRFKIEIGSSLKTWPEIMTAVQLRRPINLSVCVGNNFNKLNSEGIIGVDRGTGNHAVCVYGGAKRLASGKWAILMYNSWSTKWGNDGFGWLVEEHFKNQRYFEAYSINAVSEDSQGPVLPPVARADRTLPVHV